MTPSILSRQLHRGIRDFIGTTFPMASPYFAGMVDRFLDKSGNVFKGPYYQLSMPFEHAKDADIPFSSLRLSDFQPFSHQTAAWQRLSGDRPLSTIIATGTGSGKTECFLYPILDYCAKHRGPGIKAILIYPMNAVADDQARRIARLIHDQAGLSGLRAGVYTGDASSTPQKTMSAEGLITHRETLRDYPPDILLTNYKMLDFLLLRPKDQGLWRVPALRFLVVDELHSFDGAQGTDLACLIRRLRERLGRGGLEDLACVGTSATLGGHESADALRKFARDIFLADFPPDSLVEEKRLTESQFLDGTFVSQIHLPVLSDEEAMAPNPPESYLARQKSLWFPDQAWTGDDEDRIALAQLLPTHGVFQNLLRFLGGRPRSSEELRHHVRKTYATARDYPDEFIDLIMDSLFALIGHARSRTETGVVIPFLNLRVQFWMRELRRLVSDIAIPSADGASEVALSLADELSPEDKAVHLPVVHCRECHSAGWLTREPPGSAPVIQDLRQIYNGFFGESRDTIVLYPAGDEKPVADQASAWALCPSCGFLSPPESATCGHCHGAGLLQVWKHYLLDENGKFQNQCPLCGGSGDMIIMGSKAASLLAALVGQVFSSPFNTDRKLLAFSDSVQDASHRAGFLTSRAWNFSLRTAIQQVLKSQEKELSLNGIVWAFFGFWKAQISDTACYVGTFLPPDLEWLQDFASLVKNEALPPGSDLPELIDRRLSWEIMSELSFKSRIGRTLERTGTAIAAPPAALLDKAALIMAEALSEHQERFRTLNPSDPRCRHLLWGIIYRMKTQGSIDELSALQYFDAPNSFVFQRSHRYMPSLFPRYPRIAASNGGRRSREPIYAASGRPSWYQSWFQAWLSRWQEDQGMDFALSDPSQDEEAVGIAFEALEKAGIVRRTGFLEDCDGWVLDADTTLVYKQVASLRCSLCGHTIQVQSQAQDLLVDAPCLRFDCPGRYNAVQESDAEKSNYYRNLYTFGQVSRINGREHTGLLKGADRKKLEEAFIAGKHPWDPNLLSATPTLEMGINIGDLSTIFLCSVPPGVANYLQRIGRSGRKEGNSYILTMANAVPHDQYFFQSPEEMLRGSVETPGIYLEAGAVLERHLTAFALGKWIRGLPVGVDPMPRTIGDAIAARTAGNRERFPLAFFDVLRSNSASWIEAFLDVFSYIHTGDETEQHLRGWILPDSQGRSNLEDRLDSRLSAVSEEIRRLKRRKTTLQEKKRELEALGSLTEEQSANRDELENEAESLSIAIKQLRQKDTWQFLCDEGILPNYAFPETGVTLKATFFRKNDQPNATSKFTYENVELVRSAGSALRELAPENEFYGCGHKMKINKVDLQASKLEVWRFCPACSHAVPDTHGDFGLEVCPLCGSQAWADIGQVKNLLRFRQVYSFSNYKDSLISDDQEDREPLFYNTKLLMDFQPGDSENRYFGLENGQIPLALEFIRRATFRELNFGKMDHTKQGFPVAGDRRSKPGFSVCPLCGSLTEKHAPDCPHNKRSILGSDGKEMIHLYHEFVSEAIRLLVPVVEFGEEENIAVQSLIAALYLGLKKVYGGKADHLSIVEDRTQSPSGSTLHYLVIYDTIPGGSGYLKNFFIDARNEQTNTFFSILTAASDALSTCSCAKDPEKDGCYRCLLSRKVSYRMKEVSRTKAMQAIEAILRERTNLVRLPEPSLGRVDPLFDSRLEEIFLTALKAPHLWPIALRLSPELYHGKTGHLVRAGAREYHLEQQCLVSAQSDGIKVSATADFLFWPLAEGEKPVVVFLDGFAFHKDTIAIDANVRLSLVRWGGFRVFSFSWEDIKAVLDKAPSTLDSAGHPWIRKNLTTQQTNSISQYRARKKLISADWPGCEQPMGFIPFVAMLSMEEKLRDELWVAKAASSFMENFLTSPNRPQDVREFFKTVGVSNNEKGSCCMRPASDDGEHSLTLALLNGAGGSGLEQFGIARFDDAKEPSKESWNNYLDLLNLYQILPRFYWTTTSSAIDAGWLKGFEPAAASARDGWEETFDLVARSWIPLLQHLYDSGAPVPEIGYEFITEAGLVSATAEIAWAEKKVAILDTSFTIDISAIPQGWRLARWEPGADFPALEFGGTA